MYVDFVRDFKDMYYLIFSESKKAYSSVLDLVTSFNENVNAPW